MEPAEPIGLRLPLCACFPVTLPDRERQPPSGPAHDLATLFRSAGCESTLHSGMFLARDGQLAAGPMDLMRRHGCPSCSDLVALTGAGGLL
jgi:hypothetical protein